MEYDQEVERCPWSLVTEEVKLWITIWQQFTAMGVLPFGGSDLMEYPAQYLEAFSLCEQVKNETTEAAHKARQKDLERQRVQNRRR